MESFFKHQPTPVQEIINTLLQSKGLRLLVKRDDQIHPWISGNKWRKLKYNLIRAREEDQATLLTFGGAYSNHIYATAAAGKAFGLETIGVIRGERIDPLNPTLQFAEQSGMQLHFINRSAYRQKNYPLFLEELKNHFGDFYLIPEGGTNELALKGGAELVGEVEQQLDTMPDYWCVACGTGGTLAGLITGLKGRKKAVGFAVLKGNFHQKEISQLLGRPIFANWQVSTKYHFGGYAKFELGLIDFINHFKKENNIQLDPLYTGKLFYGLFDLIKNNYFKRGSSILAIHTGGLQGIKGFNQRFGDLINTKNGLP